MCHESTLVPIPEWATRARETFDPTHPEYGIDKQGRQCFAIDSCIVPALLAVWDAGFKTTGCCCGHESGHGVISLDLGWANQAGVMQPWLLEHHCVLCGMLHGNKEGEPLPDWAKDAQGKPVVWQPLGDNWAERIEIAKAAREGGRILREGKER